jgi:hemerythrin
VLRQLSRHLRYAVRTDDVVCRLGGDEFLIICANTSQAGALQVAETMRKAVSELRVPAGIGVWKGSVSVGVSTRTEQMNSLEDLIKNADEGVYVAKRNGRNCVVGSNDKPSALNFEKQ